MRQHLAIYADGELPTDLHRDVEARLALDAEGRIEVDLWRALRRCANRGLWSEAPPAGWRQRLTERIDAARSAHRRRRIFRLSLTVTAAAAVVVLALVAGTPGDQSFSGNLAELPTVTADRVAAIYRKCALTHHHDPEHLCGRSQQEIEQLLARSPEVRFASHVPDLSASGYRLAGVCRCSPAKGISAIHVHYARTGAGDGANQQPQDVLSFFAIATPVRLCDSQECCGRHCPGHHQRSYAVARTAGDETVLKWDESSHSYAVCSALAQDHLMQIVESINVAELTPVDRPAVAATWGQPKPVSGGLVGLVTALLLGWQGADRTR